MIGRTILHYQILAKLGEGGMGVVYKAEDTKLKRAVAIKFLPPQIAASEEERERFKIEAQAAAALNHPNIATIHAIEEHDDEMFIVMEYIEGRELREIINTPLGSASMGELRGGAMPIEAVINYATQIASGLQAAHKKGVIHRDIKSANIMVTEEGQVKIMDFGLAKLSDKTQLTKKGATVGTVAYMSPEQTHGIGVDHRTDIWSFGVVLYEMLTGALPFKAEYEAGMIYAIMHHEPQRVSEQRVEIPAQLTRVVEKALRKEPDERYHKMQDLLVDLEMAIRMHSPHPSTDESKPDSMGVARKMRPVKTPRTLWLIVLVVVVVVTITGFLKFYVGLGSDSDPPPMRTVRLTSFPGEEYNPALSSDGNAVAFSWNGPDQDNFDIYVKYVDAGSPLRLTADPAGDYRPAWSPSGRFIAFVRALPQKNELYLIPTLGGPERKLVDLEVQWHSSVCWSKDGKFILISDRPETQRSFAIFKLSVETLEKEQLTKPPSEYFGDHTPRLSPDQKTLAYVRMERSGGSDVYLESLRTGETKQITFDRLPINGMAWTPDGRDIILSRSRDGELTFLKVKVADGSVTPLPWGGENGEDPSISTMQNRLVYSQSTRDVNIWQVEIRDPSEPHLLISSTQQNYSPCISPDNKKIAFSSNRTGGFEVWVCDRDGKNSVQLTELYGVYAMTLRWSPDGKQIAFSSPASGSETIYVINADGGKPRQLTLGDYEATLPSWSGDGRWVYFSSNQTGTYQIWKVPSEGGEAVQVTDQGGAPVFESADAEFIYYPRRSPAEDAILRWDIYRRPITGGAETVILQGIGAASDEVFVFVNWMLTENGIYFVNWNLGEPNARFEFFDFVTRNNNRVANLKIPYDLSGFALSPDEKYGLYPRAERVHSDIILWENFR